MFEFARLRRFNKLVQVETNLFKNSKVQILLIIVTVWVFYAQVISFGFIWDDDNAILNNLLVKKSSGLFEIWFGQGSIDFWPMTYTVYWCLYRFFHGSSAAFHLANLMVFSCEVYLIFKILMKLDFRYAFWVAALYALHPLNAESVAWALQIKTNFSNLFGLIAVYLFIGFVQTGKKVFYVTAVASFLISLLFKISLVMLPVGIALYVWFFHRSKRNILALTPFFLISLILGLVNIFWYPVVSADRTEIVLESDYFLRLCLVGKTFLFYITTSLWPYPLMLVHPRWIIDVTSWTNFIPIAVVILLLVFSIYNSFIRKKITIFDICLWCLILVLFPVSGLFEVYFMKYSYVSEHWLGLGLVPIVVLTVVFIFRYIPYPNFIMGIVCVSAATLLFFHLPKFESNRTLFTYNLEYNNQSSLIFNTLGLVEKLDQNIPQAIDYFKKSVFAEANADGFFNLAAIAYDQNNWVEAEKLFRLGLKYNPANSQAYVHLGVMYAKANKLEAAEQEFKRAIRADPQYSQAYYNLGRMKENAGLLAEARPWYEAAFKIEPENITYQQALERIKN